jgi:hypothetical protein
MLFRLKDNMTRLSNIKLNIGFIESNEKNLFQMKKLVSSGISCIYAGENSAFSLLESI